MFVFDVSLSEELKEELECKKDDECDWEELKKKTEKAAALGLTDLVSVLQADPIATLDKLKEAEHELRKMKQKNAHLRDENAHLKEVPNIICFLTNHR